MRNYLWALILLISPSTVHAQAITVSPIYGGYYDSNIGDTIYRLGFMSDLQIRVKPTVVPNGWVTNLTVMVYTATEYGRDLQIYRNTDLASSVVVVNGVPTLDLSIWGGWETYLSDPDMRYIVYVSWTSWDGVNTGSGLDNTESFKLE